MSDYLDGALPPDDAARLEGHLADCPHCTEYLAQLRLTVAALGRSAAHEEVPEEVVDELVLLYRRWREA